MRSPPAPVTDTTRAQAAARRWSGAARARLALTLCLAVYGIAIMRDPNGWNFLSGVDLLIHEAGHPVFGLLGEFLAAAGGTIMQLLFPVAFIVYFARRRDFHSASVALWWVAQNLWGISIYAGDARAQELPLLNDGEHDWGYMLDRLQLLAHDQGIARGIFFAGFMCYAAAILIGLRTANQSAGEAVSALRS